MCARRCLMMPYILLVAPWHEQVRATPRYAVAVAQIQKKQRTCCSGCSAVVVQTTALQPLVLATHMVLPALVYCGFCQMSSACELGASPEDLLDAVHGQLDLNSHTDKHVRQCGVRASNNNFTCALVRRRELDQAARAAASAPSLPGAAQSLCSDNTLPVPLPDGAPDINICPLPHFAAAVVAAAAASSCHPHHLL